MPRTARRHRIIQFSSDPEPDADDWDLEPVELKAKATQEEAEMEGSGSRALGALHLEEIDWNDINDEVEAAMMESDDESVDERMKSDDELTDESSVASARYAFSIYQGIVGSDLL